MIKTGRDLFFNERNHILSFFVFSTSSLPTSEEWNTFLSYAQFNKWLYIYNIKHCYTTPHFHSLREKQVVSMKEFLNLVTSPFPSWIQPRVSYLKILFSTSSSPHPFLFSLILTTPLKSFHTWICSCHISLLLKAVYLWGVDCISSLSIYKARSKISGT